MWRLGGRGALRTWHNQFCLNCFNEETFCDLLDLVGPRRRLLVLTWWVLRYFGSHCKSVITLQPNRKMQKRFEQASYVCTWFGTKFQFVRKCSDWWDVVIGSKNIHSMIDISSALQFTMLSMRLECNVMCNVISCDLRGKDRWRGAPSSQIRTQDVCMMKSFGLQLFISYTYRVGAIVTIICLAELIIIEELINKMRKLLSPPATGQSIAKLGTRRIIR